MSYVYKRDYENLISDFNEWLEGQSETKQGYVESYYNSNRNIEYGKLYKIVRNFNNDTMFFLETSRGSAYFGTGMIPKRVEKLLIQWRNEKYPDVKFYGGRELY